MGVRYCSVLGSGRLNSSVRGGLGRCRERQGVVIIEGGGGVVWWGFSGSHISSRWGRNSTLNMSQKTGNQNKTKSTSLHLPRASKRRILCLDIYLKWAPLQHSSEKTSSFPISRQQLGLRITILPPEGRPKVEECHHCWAFICLSVCQRDYAKTTRLNSRKIGEVEERKSSLHSGVNLHHILWKGCVIRVIDFVCESQEKGYKVKHLCFLFFWHVQQSKTQRNSIKNKKK